MSKIDLSVNGECVPEVCKSKCCTSILPLSDYEINKIKKYIKRNNITPHNRSNLIENKYKDICPFLSDDYKCEIYLMRPEVCKFYKCGEEASKPFCHGDKKIINMLTTFDPDTFIPPDAPNVEELDKIYQSKKKEIYSKE